VVAALVVAFQFTRPRGARLRLAAQPGGITCFNSRARAGRDCLDASSQAGKTRFNSRARAGRDRHRQANIPGSESVSIHAPARGATVLIMAKTEAKAFQFTRPRGARRFAATPVVPEPAFQFTRPRGARHNCTVKIPAMQAWFQFTRPRGARLFRPVDATILPCFNSRARAGRDLMVPPGGGSRCVVSIHAPARGAT